jgi:hypothetical protein
MHAGKLPSLFQFSIRTLLVAVTIAALGVTALLNANLWWEGGTWLVALAFLAGGILLAIYRQGEQRAYWLGFIIFGGLYLGMLLFTALIDRSYELAPSQLLQYAYSWAIPAARQSQYVQINPTNPPPPAVSYTYTVLAASPYAPPTFPSPAPPPAPVRTFPALPAPVLPATSIPNSDYVPIDKFVSIGQSLLLLLAAAAGGKTCQLIYRRRPQT